MDRERFGEFLRELVAQHRAEKAKGDCSDERLEHLHVRADYFVVMLKKAKEDPVDWPTPVLKKAFHALKELEVARRKQPREVVKSYPSAATPGQLYWEMTTGDHYTMALHVFGVAIEKSSYELRN